MSVELKLSRSNRVYRPDVRSSLITHHASFSHSCLFWCCAYNTNLSHQEPIQGKIVVTLSSSISHQGIRISLNGTANLQVSSLTIIRTSLIFNYNCIPLVLNLLLMIFLSWRFEVEWQEWLSPCTLRSSPSLSCKCIGFFVVWLQFDWNWKIWYSLWG